MKGLEVGIERMIYIIAAIVFIVIIISIARNLLSKAEIERDEIIIDASKERTVDRLVKLIEYCWEKNKDEFEGKVCYTVHMDLNKNITERDVASKLDCNTLPDNKCLRGNCSFCTSFKYEGNDKIDWRDEINEGNRTILIKYVPKNIVLEKKLRVIG